MVNILLHKIISTYDSYEICIVNRQINIFYGIFPKL